MNNSKLLYNDFDDCIAEALRTKNPEEALMAYYNTLNYDEREEFKKRLYKLNVEGIDSAKLLYEIGGY